MTPDRRPDASETIRRYEGIVLEIKLVSDGSYGADFFVTAARSLLLDVLENDSPRTWEELQQCVIRRNLSRQARTDGSMDLLSAIGHDRRGPLPG